jgi:hypothetical protein
MHSLAAAPPEAPPASRLGWPVQVYLAGRGRGVQREAVDPPSSKAQAQSGKRPKGGAAARSRLERTPRDEQLETNPKRRTTRSADVDQFTGGSRVCPRSRRVTAASATRPGALATVVRLIRAPIRPLPVWVWPLAQAGGTCFRAAAGGAVLAADLYNGAPRAQPRELHRAHARRLPVHAHVKLRGTDRLPVTPRDRALRLVAGEIQTWGKRLEYIEGKRQTCPDGRHRISVARRPTATSGLLRRPMLAKWHNSASRRSGGYRSANAILSRAAT